MIYICTHKDFELPKFDLKDDYKIISCNPLEGNYNVPVIYADNDLNDMKKSYCEVHMIRDIYEKCDDDWIGINHYRRYFNNLELGKNTLPTPSNFGLNWQYQKCHRIKDLLQCEQIIDNYFPDYSLPYENINILYTANMFYIEREIFRRYCEFTFGVLDIFNEQNHLTNDKEIFEFVGCNSYQSRLHGFLHERIGTIFFLNEFRDKTPTIKNIIKTQ